MVSMQGHPCDQRHLGKMYEHGIGVERDPDAALLWYQKAADRGGYFERSQITELERTNSKIVNQIERPGANGHVGSFEELLKLDPATMVSIKVLPTT